MRVCLSGWLWETPGGTHNCRCVSPCSTSSLTMRVRWNSCGWVRFAYVVCALSFISWVQSLPYARTWGRVVWRWSFSRSGFACVASSSMVSEFATLLALVWKARVENLLSNCVCGCCSFRPWMGFWWILRAWRYLGPLSLPWGLPASWCMNLRLQCLGPRQACLPWW